MRGAALNTLNTALIPLFHMLAIGLLKSRTNQAITLPASGYWMGRPALHAPAARGPGYPG